MNLLCRLQFCAVVALLFSASILHLQAIADDDVTALPNSTTTNPSTTNTTTPRPPPSSTTQGPQKKDAADCPASCTCTPASSKPAGIRIDCSESNLKSIPSLSKYSNVTEINLSNNLIELLDVVLLPTSQLLVLDLSNNRLRRVVVSRKAPLNQLRELNLSGNALVDLSTTFSLMKLPSLDLLDLSNNPVEKLTQTTFDNCQKVSLLHLSQLTSLESIHESVFGPLVNLKALKLASGSLENVLHPSDKLFLNNQKLQILNVGNNSLVDVPAAIRSVQGLKMLFLDENLMSSLRQSDFMNLFNLTTLSITECPKLTNIDDLTFSGMSMLRFLILSNNPKLKYISADAFKSAQNVTINLAKLDLSGNNLTTIHDPRLFTSLNLTKVDLSNNPFNCDCDIKWLTSMAGQLSAPVHCGAPEKFKDLEVGAFFATKSCDPVVESSFQTLILAGFLLFLAGLLVALFVQRSETCRRLLWKDQYGTIYYTKANFQPEIA